MFGVDDVEAVARHEAAHAVTAVAQGGKQISARVRAANTGGWKGDSTFPDNLPLKRERIVVKLVGFLAEVKLGGTTVPKGHGSDVERARTTAIELVQAGNGGERATETEIATTLAVAAAVATRFLERVWDIVNAVAAELIAKQPDYVEVDQVVDVDEVKAAYAAAERGLDDVPES